jgi:hypothetical protein
LGSFEDASDLLLDITGATGTIDAGDVISERPGRSASQAPRRQRGGSWFGTR